MSTDASLHNAPANGVFLRFYTHVHARHEGLLLSEWLLELAKRNKLGGGSVFRATAGFGRHGVLHHEAFFELADDLPLKVEFLLSQAHAQTLLRLVQEAGVDLVYAWSPIHFGVLGKEGAA
jgi:PII-like signaling protein